MHKDSRRFAFCELGLAAIRPEHVLQRQELRSGLGELLGVVFLYPAVVGVKLIEGFLVPVLGEVFEELVGDGLVRGVGGGEGGCCLDTEIKEKHR